MANVIDEPRVVEAGRGVAWWGEGWRIFTSNFWAWIGIMIVYMIISGLMSRIPYVGVFGQWLLTPVFTGGVMLGCQAIHRGERLRVAHLFEGFQGAHFVPLMIIGAINLAIIVICGLAIAGISGTSLLAVMMQPGAMDDPIGAIGEMGRAVTGTVLLLVLFGIVIAAVFAMLNWFAPALVALQGASATQAMKLSFSASLRNWVPFLVYGLIAIVAGVAILLVMSVLALLFGTGAILSVLFSAGTILDSSLGGLGALIGLALLYMLVVAVFVLVVGPTVFASIYASYRDTLAVDEAAPVNPAYR